MKLGTWGWVSVGVGAIVIVFLAFVAGRWSSPSNTTKAEEAKVEAEAAPATTTPVEKEAKVPPATMEDKEFSALTAFVTSPHEGSRFSLPKTGITGSTGPAATAEAEAEGKLLLEKARFDGWVADRNSRVEASTTKADTPRKERKHRR